MSISRGVDKMWCAGTVGPLSHRKDKTMPFAATWVDLEIVTLSEGRQTPYDTAYMQNLRKWYTFTNVQNKS